MNKIRSWGGFVGAAIVVLLLAGCASAPPRPIRSEFDDIQIPRGLKFHVDESTIIESPTVKAGRLIYTGLIEGTSLAQAFRGSLEGSGWRFISTNIIAGKGILQTYEKDGNSLQLHIEDRWWWTTRVEMTVTKTVSAAGTTVHASPLPDMK